MFPNKNWTLSGVKTVSLLSKIDATGSIESCSGRDPLCTTRSPDTISDMATEQWDLNHVDYGVWGYKSVYTSATGSQTWKSCASVSRMNGTVWTRK